MNFDATNSTKIMLIGRENVIIIVTRDFNRQMADGNNINIKFVNHCQKNLKQKLKLKLIK